MDEPQAPLKANLSRLAQQSHGLKVRLLLLIQQLTLQNITEWLLRIAQKRTHLPSYASWVTLILSSYFISDIVVLWMDSFFPEKRHSYKTISIQNPHTQTPQDYAPIYTRNLLSSRGLIPGDDGLSQAGVSVVSDQPAIKTSLPLNLIGTLVVTDPQQSIATLEDKSSATTYVIRTEDEIPGKLKIVLIEAKRVTFIHLASGRKEYIETSEVPTPLLQTHRIQQKSSGIEKLSATQFNIQRSEVDRALSDMTLILTQARAVPYSERGVPAGYQLFQIVPGSIYEKLGLKDGDIITGINGQAIGDPTKIFEMLSDLKTAQQLELQIKKAGKQVTYTYSIHS